MSECEHIVKFSEEKVSSALKMIKFVVAHSSQKEKWLKLADCSTCHEINQGACFVCLDCKSINCWNNKCMATHANELDHAIGINSNSGLIFCFKCMDYINYESNDDNRNISFPTVTNRDGLHGFVNMGSTCFMSSILQVLIHNPFIVQNSMSQSHYSSCKIRNPNNCISCALDEIIAESYGNFVKYNNGKPINQYHDGFISMLNCSWKINDNFAGYSQQDAHEFLQFILNRLHRDYKLTSTYTNNTDSCSCLIHSIFQGKLKSSIVCPECHDNSKTVTDPYIDLSLDIKDKATLYQCLDSFHKKETLHDYNYHCPNCDTMQDPIKQLTIDKLPPVLVLQLKRFEHLNNGQNVKLNAFIEFPTYLNMKKYCHTEENNSSIIYELNGVISHIGTVNEGHYIATLKLDSNNWFKFNDSMVTSISEEEVLKDQAYLLFYSIKQVN
ncbi:hypothetical protein KAFR_0A04210 [Kazachstania africana CBS 2517]|uniref:Ubiquitin carboxyl-terminal hydrolase n=1 Tax=Kazachstania africana (strain ATCC 22294 / BCRC 22015 / CBS 2517 / CECT 1963 / NBRC 1671 / NRRL Y-8276) TaxID=1071382 RepID=H2ANA6_KAZAF|nr:hypothetical protein KAFR_0A04210 [Kazachstania africana CBS 2517]CCF55856.1 hypothetical protein KAFR_0A04210 [Kazachstania africana CBS 2517]